MPRQRALAPARAKEGDMHPIVIPGLSVNDGWRGYVVNPRYRGASGAEQYRRDLEAVGRK